MKPSAPLAEWFEAGKPLGADALARAIVALRNRGLVQHLPGQLACAGPDVRPPVTAADWAAAHLAD